MSDTFVHTFACMGTVVTMRVGPHDGSPERERERSAAVRRASAWFREVERTCNRFDAGSELRQLSRRIREAVPVTPLLFEAVRFALAVAAESHGAFDPTIGQRMETRGFNRDYRTGRVTQSDVVPEAHTSYTDVQLDADSRTITLRQPLLLDLGAVAKGLAMDLAARELAPFENFVIDAGGDLYLGGTNARHEPWSVGIRHPRNPDVCITTLRASNAAVCTSGDYERRTDDGADHHLLDARTGVTAGTVASVTVRTSSAMVADALGTAAFALGIVEGRAFLERHGVDGLLVTPSLDCVFTNGLHGE